MTYRITNAYLTETYDADGFDTREVEVDFPDVATLDELIENARSTCQKRQMWSDFYAPMTMGQEPSVSTDIQDGEGCVYISFGFVEGDFATDMSMSYTVREVAE